MSDAPVTFVLGAGGGIGSALVRRLVDAGGQVVAAGRTAGPLDALVAAHGSAVRPLVVDATDADAVHAAVGAVADTEGRLDAAACTVGSILLKPAHRTSVEEYRDVLARNLDAAFFLLRAATAALQRSGGSIALVSSAAGHYGLHNHEAIAAAKGGIEGLTRSAAATYAARGIRVNAVAPGLVETPLTARLTGDETSRRVSEGMHPLGRIGAPDDVASALAWLLDPAQSWVTGQVLGVDGGLGSAQPKRAG